jgi:hypothetical protein
MTTTGQEDEDAQKRGPADPPASTGEGADTALEALIRKRRMRGDDGGDDLARPAQRRPADLPPEP